MERVRGIAVRGAWVVLVAVAACGPDDRTRLHVRTSLPAELRSEVEALYEAAHPGVDVTFSAGDVDASLRALLAWAEDRRGDPPFDVWWGAPSTALERAARAGAVVWRPILATPFVVAFDRTVVPIAEAPSDWIDLFHHAWYDDVRLHDPARGWIGATFAGMMIVRALREDGDPVSGFDWLARLDDQVDVYAGSSEELVRALDDGGALLAIMPRAEAEQARAGPAPWLHYRIPTSGVPELVLGAGAVRATNAEPTGDEAGGDAASAFLDLLETSEVATASKLRTRWDPVGATVDATALPADFELVGSWTTYPPALDTLTDELDGWIRVWDLDVRGR